MKITKQHLRKIIKEELEAMVPDVPGEVRGDAQIDFDDLAESLRLIMTELVKTKDSVSRARSRDMAKEVLLGKMRLSVAIRKLIRGTKLTTKKMLDDPLAID
tara:strand:- start:173 stop:478 length:306 start_codon:yes stop_codon:yes gene_type:complete